jgi:hypothetical protein
MTQSTRAHKALSKTTRALAVAACAAALAAVPSAALATSGPSNNPFNLWEKFGSSWAMGNATLTAGTPMITVTHPGRTLQWFFTGGTYMGNSVGNITTSNGMYVAANTACAGVTLKTDPAAFGTAWTFKTEGGDLVVISRPCDQAAGSHNTVGMALTGSSHSGDQWLISSGGFRAVLTPAA